MGQIEVCIDSREKSRISRAIQFFNQFEGYSTKVKELKTGDFVCGNCCIEYKTTSDFITSVRSKRLFRQAIRMSNNYKHHFVFIETEYSAMKEAIKTSYWRTSIRFSWNQYYGSLASLCQMTTPIIVHDFDEALKFMEFLFRKCNDNKVRSIVPVTKKYDNFLVNCLASIDDIGANTALLIVESLDLKTFTELCNITYDDLIKIKGIGDKTATNIMSAIGKDDYGKENDKKRKMAR